MLPLIRNYAIMKSAQFQSDHCTERPTFSLSRCTRNATKSAHGLSLWRMPRLHQDVLSLLWWAIKDFCLVSRLFRPSWGVGGQSQGTALFLFNCSLINNLSFNLFFSHTHTRPGAKWRMPGNGIIIEKEKHKPAIERSRVNLMINSIWDFKLYFIVGTVEL